VNSRFPDQQTVQTALSLAVRAPSAHNSQPWHWRVDAESLHLYAHRSRQLRATDPDDRDLLLSCGAALHHCVVALAAVGWQATVHRFPEPANHHHLARITVTPAPPSEADIRLVDAIGRRRTDRRHYGNAEVSPADIALIGARVARMGVTMRRIESIAQLNGLVEQAISKHIGDADYFTELTCRSEYYQFLALGTRDDDTTARLRAGEATSLVLLTATALGLATCPITEPLEVDETRAALREEFFDSREYPQMLIRIGWPAEQTEPLPATPRRPALI
jgi:nitroreductase